MKKRFLSLLLALVMCLSLLPMTALAAENVVLDVTVRDFKKDDVLFDGNIGARQGLVSETLGADKKPVYNLQLWQEEYGSSVTQADLNAFFNDVSGVNMTTKKQLTMRPDGEGYWVIDSSMDADGNYLDGFFPIDNELFGNEEYHHNYHFSVEIHTRFKYVQGAEFDFEGDDDVWVFFNNKLVIDLGGIHGAESASVSMDEIAGKLGIKVGDTVSFDMFYMERCYSGSNMYIRTNFEFLNLNASSWATEGVARADELGLIPDSLKGADLTADITRKEFAAVAVKTYEVLSGTVALPATSNPFTDCKDVEVLKAYNLGVVAGTSATTFDPEALLTREQAAVMLTRVFQRSTVPGWPENSPPLKFEMPTLFADDKDISGWARESVYFMTANGIIAGVGDNKFAPKNTTTEQQAAGYANATREQALVIAVRMVENLGT